MKITVLNESDMRGVFSMQEAIQADKDALAAYSSGGVNIPLRANLDVPEHNGQSLYMYGYVPSAEALGVKMVSIFTDNYKLGLPNVPATMVLLDSVTGQVCALLDGTYLTRVRTGAVAGAGTDLLARKDAKVFALIGTGGQAETQLEAVLAVRKIELVKICSGHFDRAQAFAERMSAQFAEKYGVKIIAVPTPDEAVRDADVITAVTTAKSPVFDGAALKAGVHVNGVGSYTPDMIEVPESVVLGAGKLYVDTMDAVAEAGDFRSLIDRGVFSESMVTGELGDLINGKTKGRESESELTFFKTTGNAVLDLVTARRIYLRAVEQGIGSTSTIDL